VPGADLRSYVWMSRMLTPTRRRAAKSTLNKIRLDEDFEQTQLGGCINAIENHLADISETLAAIADIYDKSEMRR